VPVINANTGIVTQINVFTVPEGGQQALIEFLAEAAKFASTTPGWISASVHHSRDGTRVVNYAHSESLEAAKSIIDRLREAGLLERNKALGEAHPAPVRRGVHARTLAPCDDVPVRSFHAGSNRTLRSAHDRMSRRSLQTSPSGVLTCGAILRRPRVTSRAPARVPQEQRKSDHRDDSTEGRCLPQSSGRTELTRETWARCPRSMPPNSAHRRIHDHAPSLSSRAQFRAFPVRAALGSPWV
jgi:hypothetical protein